MKYIIEDTTLTDIGDAIRGKKGTSALIPVPDLASEISSIPQGITPSGTVNITSNGNVDVTQYANANVNVPQGITPTGQISITENGTFDVTSFASALVNVSGGGGIEGYAIEVGEFTPYEDINVCQSRRSSDEGSPSHNPYTIQHNLGIVPDLFFVDGDFSYVSSLTSSVLTHAHSYKYVISTNKRTRYSSYLSRTNSSSNNNGATVDVENPTTRDIAYVGLSETQAFVGDKDGVTTLYQNFILKAGITYYWVAVAKED